MNEKYPEREQFTQVQQLVALGGAVVDLVWSLRPLLKMQVPRETTLMQAHRGIRELSASLLPLPAIPSDSHES